MGAMGARLDISLGKIAGLAADVGDGLLELVWPTRCVGCDRPGSLLCDDCRAELPLIAPEEACTECGAPYGVLACTECWCRDGHIDRPFARAACAMEFEGVAARLVVAYKDQGERRLADLMAAFIADAVRASWRLQDDGEALAFPEVIVPVPATPEALARRGFDHMLLVAQRLSGRLGLPVLQPLSKADAADQRDLGREERQANMADVFALSSAEPLPRRILLLDDVFTTGATLSAAAGLLLEAGAEEVSAAALCRVW